MYKTRALTGNVLLRFFCCSFAFVVFPSQIFVIKSGEWVGDFQKGGKKQAVKLEELKSRNQEIGL